MSNHLLAVSPAQHLTSQHPPAEPNTPQQYEECWQGVLEPQHSPLALLTHLVCINIVNTNTFTAITCSRPLGSQLVHLPTLHHLLDGVVQDLPELPILG